MLEIIYRIYEVVEPKQPENVYAFWDLSNKVELTMDCKICDSREHFKELIREEYGDIPFRNSKKLKAGDIYCIIIAEHCYNTERYFNRIEYNCAYCGGKVSGYVDKGERIGNYEIKNYLCNQTDIYSGLRFCSYTCKERFIERERRKCLDDGLVDESFITRDEFKTNGINGYIYKITKKSTNEFYIGQTNSLPIFRWGQHLKTSRFPISNITDYKFEVLEIVSESDNILEREKYYIQKCYLVNPEKSLNISCTANLITESDEQISFFEE